MNIGLLLVCGAAIFLFVLIVLAIIWAIHKRKNGGEAYVDGVSAAAAGEIAGLYDREGYPNHVSDDHK